MVNTPKRAGDGEIVENPDKRTISQGNKELRAEQDRENCEPGRDVSKTPLIIDGSGQGLQPGPHEPGGEDKREKTQENRASPAPR